MCLKTQWAKDWQEKFFQGAPTLLNQPLDLHTISDFYRVMYHIHPQDAFSVAQYNFININSSTEVVQYYTARTWLCKSFKRILVNLRHIHSSSRQRSKIRAWSNFAIFLTETKCLLLLRENHCNILLGIYSPEMLPSPQEERNQYKDVIRTWKRTKKMN